MVIGILEKVVDKKEVVEVDGNATNGGNVHIIMAGVGNTQKANLHSAIQIHVCWLGLAQTVIQEYLQL